MSDGIKDAAERLATLTREREQFVDELAAKGLAIGNLDQIEASFRMGLFVHAMIETFVGPEGSPPRVLFELEFEERMREFIDGIRQEIVRSQLAVPVGGPAGPIVTSR